MTAAPDNAAPVVPLPRHVAEVELNTWDADWEIRMHRPKALETALGEEGKTFLYTADQLRQYAAACVEADRAGLLSVIAELQQDLKDREELIERISEEGSGS